MQASSDQIQSKHDRKTSKTTQNRESNAERDERDLVTDEEHETAGKRGRENGEDPETELGPCDLELEKKEECC